MKSKFFNLIIIGFVLVHIHAKAQITPTIGVEIKNDPKSTFNKMLGCDEKNFYVYRLKKEGIHYLETYDSKTMALVSSKLVDFSKEDNTKRMRLLDIVYAQNNFYAFKYYRDKSTDIYHYCYEIINKDGLGSEDVTFYDSQVEPAEVKIDYNQKKTKIAIAMVFYLSKEKEITTHFFGLDIATHKIWNKEVLRFPSSAYTTNFQRFDKFQNGIAVYIDEFDNVHFTIKKNMATSTTENSTSETVICTYDAKSQTVKVIALGTPYTRFMMNTSVDGELNLSGFVADDYNSKAEKTTNHLSFLNIKINTKTGSLIPYKKEVGRSLIEALEAYINTDMVYTTRDFFTVGTDTYYIGEQCRYKQIPTEPGVYSYKITNTAVLITKVNSKKEIQWISQVPTRFLTSQYYNNVKQFISTYTDKTLYIFNNEHADNLPLVSTQNIDPASLKDLSVLNSTNFVYTSLSLSDGKIINHGLVFKEKGYGFNPYVPDLGKSQFYAVQHVDLTVQPEKNALIMHTDDHNLSRFVKIKFE